MVNQTNLDTTLRSVTNAVVCAGNVLQREAGRLFRPAGVTAAQFNALHLLSDCPRGLRPGEIAQSMVVDPSSITYLLDQLERRGWAARKRDAADRRALKIVLTPAGRRLHGRLAVLYAATLRRMAAAVDPVAAVAALSFLETLPPAAAAAVDAQLAAVSARPVSSPRRRRLAS